MLFNVASASIGSLRRNIPMALQKGDKMSSTQHVNFFLFIQYESFSFKLIIDEVLRRRPFQMVE